MYTDDKNAQIVLALLKKYKIRRVVVSPGTTNVPIAKSVQDDSFFEVYSFVDERGAAYFAGGLAFTTGEPVVISCTGATASRDYIPGLTEAFYRKLPVIALTSQHHSSTYHDLVPQMTDRTVTQNDIKRFAAFLPTVDNKSDFKKCENLVNEALIYATKNGGGPVHINLPVNPSYSFTTVTLPKVKKIDYYEYDEIPYSDLSKELRQKKVAIFIGSHKKFSKETEDAINRFVKIYDAVVFYDHTSSYKGQNGVRITQGSLALEKDELPELVIDIGSICGDYFGGRLFSKRTTWRVSEDGIIHNRYDSENLTKVFNCKEGDFFNRLCKSGIGRTHYYSTIVNKSQLENVPKLPFSNMYVCSKLSKLIPNGSLLHMSILNSLRCMNFFDIDRSVVTSSNVGGFGIDGALSTLLGQSMGECNKLAFCVVGDLAFFYDMNSLGNRHIDKRLRILLINNGLGVEFRLNNRLESQWGSDSDQLIAAKGHFGSARGWVESMGFEYIESDNQHDFDIKIKQFCNPDVNAYDKPIVFEVFTRTIDEQQALDNMKNYIIPVIKV